MSHSTLNCGTDSLNAMDSGNAISIGVLNAPHPNQLPTIAWIPSLSVLVGDCTPHDHLGGGEGGLRKTEGLMMVPRFLS